MKDGITVCLRVVKGRLSPIELSYQDICSKCGNHIWVSPATKHLIDSGAYSQELVCLECATELLGK